jgi:hypothetical protein
MLHYRLCEDLNLTVPGTPRTEKDVSKKKRKQPTRVDCPRCGLSLRDKFVQRKHVRSFLVLCTVKSYYVRAVQPIFFVSLYPISLIDCSLDTIVL